MIRTIFCVLSAGIIFAAPQIVNADIATLPRLETSIAGDYPEKEIGDKKIGLDLEIRFGYLTGSTQYFRTDVDLNRKLSVPDLSALNVNEIKDLLPIFVTFSVPSPDISGVEFGKYYLSRMEFKSIQEYQDFFHSPLSIFFRYVYTNPLAVTVATSDGSSFASWYSSNIRPNSECLFASIKLLSPQGSQVDADFGVRINSDGTSKRGAFFVFRADKDVNYSVMLFSSSNPYVCSGSTGPSPNESLAKVITRKNYTLNKLGFPDTILISTP